MVSHIARTSIKAHILVLKVNLCLEALVLSAMPFQFLPVMGLNGK
jgi:hypothetical protein